MKKRTERRNRRRRRRAKKITKIVTIIFILSFIIIILNKQIIFITSQFTLLVITPIIKNFNGIFIKITSTNFDITPSMSFFMILMLFLIIAFLPMIMVLTLPSKQQN